MKNIEEYTFFQLGFKSHLEKTGAIGGKLMDIGKFLKSTVVPKMTSAVSQFGENLTSKYLPAAGEAAKGFGKEFISTHGAPLLGGVGGFTAAQNLYQNLSKGEELSKEKYVDDFIENMKNFLPFDLAVFSAGKAMGGFGKLYDKIKFAIKGNKEIAKKVLSANEIKELDMAINAASKAGKDFAKGHASEGAIDMVNYLPHVGAAIGAASQYDPESPVTSTAKGAVGGALVGKGIKAVGKEGLVPHLPAAGALTGMYTEYDPDAPVSSLTRGAIGGGLAGKGIGMIPSVAGGKANLANSFLDSLQVGLGMEAFSGALERKSRKEQDRQLKEYYKMLQNQMQNVSHVPGLSFRGQ